MSIHPLHSEHPVRACARVIGDALDAVADVDPAFMTSRDKAAALRELTVAVERLAGLRLRVLAGADDVALDHGARSAAAWLAHETRADLGPTLAAGRLAESLDGRWVAVREAWCAGRVSEAQARVIVVALDDLPVDLDPELLKAAEAHLVEQALHFEPRRLRVLGRKVLEVVAPGVAEDHERRVLEREEALARRQTSLRFRCRGDGTTEIHARHGDAVAGRLRTYLEAFTAPRRAHHHDRSEGGSGLGSAAEWLDPESGRPVPQPVRYGRAFCSLMEAIPTDVLPVHGGTATQLVVTVDHATLLSQVGVAGLATGDLVSVAEAMRLACRAEILPAVLDGAGQPLFLGRSRRLFSRAQRTAMGIRDRECRAHGCTVPAASCEAHHLHPWGRGGKTDLDDGLLLCSWHHHRAHDPAYASDRMPNGDIRFHRRT